MSGEEESPVKNIVIITYSTTGNTKVVEEKIMKLLQDNNFSVVSFDALAIVRAYKLGRRASESLTIEAANSPLIPNLQEAVATADVVGIGGFAFCIQPPPGLTEIFAQGYLPSELFRNMKYFFSFATAGQRIGGWHDIAATVLSEKNEKAVYLGGLTVICPENFAPLLPPKGTRDMWSQEEIDKIPPFVGSMIQTLRSLPAKGVPFKKAQYKSGYLRFMISFTCGSVQVDKQKCVKCGTCVRNCPYGGLSMSADIEDGFPTWNKNKCEFCHVCFNHCPKEAIDFSGAKTKKKSRHPSPFLDRETGAILSTDETHTIVGNRLPTPSELRSRSCVIL